LHASTTLRSLLVHQWLKVIACAWVALLHLLLVVDYDSVYCVFQAVPVRDERS